MQRTIGLIASLLLSLSTLPLAAGAAEHSDRAGRPAAHERAAPRVQRPVYRERTAPQRYEAAPRAIERPVPRAYAPRPVTREYARPPVAHRYVPPREAPYRYAAPRRYVAPHAI